MGNRLDSEKNRGFFPAITMPGKQRRIYYDGIMACCNFEFLMRPPHERPCETMTVLVLQLQSVVTAGHVVQEWPAGHQKQG